MSTTIFIIPGFKESVEQSQYTWLIRFLESKGFIVKKSPIAWNRHVMTDYLLQFKDFYKTNKTEVNYVLGFSYGAMAAFISAKDLRPDKLFLCSLSPYFHEDLKVLKPWWKVYIGIHRVLDFNKYKASEIAKEVKTPTTVLYGSIEAKKYPQLKVRCEETASLLKNGSLVLVENAPHKIDDRNYIKALKSLFT